MTKPRAGTEPEPYFTQDLTDEVLEDLRAMHRVVHPRSTSDGVFEPERNPGGCDQEWCVNALPELLSVWPKIQAAALLDAATDIAGGSGAHAEPNDSGLVPSEQLAMSRWLARRAYQLSPYPPPGGFHG